MASRGQGLTVSFTAFDVTTGLRKTGDSANITPRWIKDGTSAALTTPTVTEVDATNAPGEYKVALSGTECTCDFGTITGKSSTANVELVPVHIVFEQLPVAAPNAAGGLPISTAGALDLDDIGADVDAIETRVALALPNAAPQAAGGLITSIAGSLDMDDLAADVDATETAAAAIKVKTDNLPAAPASTTNITAASGVVLSVAGVQAIWDALTSALTTAGSIGKRLVDFVTTLVYAAAPTAGANAAAVRDVDNTTPASNSLGARVNSAGDPWSVSLPGAYASGTAGNKLGNNAVQTGDNYPFANRTVVRGTVGPTSPSTGSFTPSALSPAGVDADQFKGRILIFDNTTTTAALRGQATDITASSAATLPLLTYSTLSSAPVSGDTFSIV